jgi:NAD(P)H-hydrate epimerase
MSLETIDKLPTLPPRRADGHKGDYGRVLILAGSRGMAGAAGLVGAATLRSGAGLVRVASPASTQPIVATFEPSYMTFPLAEDRLGIVDFDAAWADLERLVADADAVAIGPGLGQSEGIRALVRWVVESGQVPTVLDADALNALVGQTEVLAQVTRPVVLTPHPGEFSRLTGRRVAEVQADRVTAAAELVSIAESLVVVLKGQGTVVTDGNRVYVNTTGNPGMATGGSGDVLTGVIAALLGQKLDAFDAAVLGTYVHGLAGDIARDQNGEVGMIAGDLVDSLPDAFFHFSQH